MFQNRAEAGQRLARALRHHANLPDGLVLAIPRGGVVVGLALSQDLGLPLDIMITRKIGAPGNPELALAALTETGFLYLNEDLLALYPSLAAAVEPQRSRQEEEIARRQAQYRGGRGLSPLAGRTVLLVDDGVATGSTFLASIAALRAAYVARLIAALPVAPLATAQKISAQVEESVVLESPESFIAVGEYYEDFTQVEDDEVIRCLAQGWHPPLNSS